MRRWCIYSESWQRLKSRRRTRLLLQQRSVDDLGDGEDFLLFVLAPHDLEADRGAIVDLGVVCGASTLLATVFLGWVQGLNHLQASQFLRSKSLMGW